MEITERRALLRGLVSEWTTHPPVIPDPVQWYPVMDDASGHYLLLLVGWEQGERIHQAALHLRLTPEGQIVLEANTTDENIVDRLVRAGIAPDDIMRGTATPHDYRVRRAA